MRGRLARLPFALVSVSALAVLPAEDYLRLAGLLGVMTVGLVVREHNEIASRLLASSREPAAAPAR